MFENNKQSIAKWSENVKGISGEVHGVESFVLRKSKSNQIHPKSLANSR
jgi:hypothetical protein